MIDIVGKDERYDAMAEWEFGGAVKRGPLSGRKGRGECLSVRRGGRGVLVGGVGGIRLEYIVTC